VSRISLVLLVIACCRLAACAQLFTPDAKSSSIRFTISNFGIEVAGRLTDFTGKILFSETNPAVSEFEIQIEMNAVTTGVALRDKHLKNENFFDVSNFPKITFRSTRVRQITPGKYQLTGNLLIKGTMKVVSIPFHVVRGAKSISFIGSLVIDRRDFGIGKNSLTMGDEVRVQVHVVAEPEPL
jgi:polyisoprenoid-binding protein YceI